MQMIKKILRVLMFTLFIVAATFIVMDWVLPSLDSGEGAARNTNDLTLESTDEANCNTAGVVLRGYLATYIVPPASDDETGTNDQSASEDIIYAIEQADDDESIKAILVEVDSFGGVTVAGEEVESAIKHATKPVIALIRAQGLSAAYLAISSADVIFASENSDVGSIGVTMSYLDYSSHNQKEGVQYVSLSAGKYKDAGDPDRPLSDEEKKLFMRDVNIVHENFIKAVAENRGLELEKIRALADGSSMMGRAALENKLIDRIGGFYEVGQYIGKRIGEKSEICW